MNFCCLSNCDLKSLKINDFIPIFVVVANSTWPLEHFHQSVCELLDLQWIYKLKTCTNWLWLFLTKQVLITSGLGSKLNVLQVNSWFREHLLLLKWSFYWTVLLKIWERGSICGVKLKFYNHFASTISYSTFSSCWKKDCRKTTSQSHGFFFRALVSYYFSQVCEFYNSSNIMLLQLSRLRFTIASDEMYASLFCFWVFHCASWCFLANVIADLYCKQWHSFTFFLLIMWSLKMITLNTYMYPCVNGIVSTLCCSYEGPFNHLYFIGR